VTIRVGIVGFGYSGRVLHAPLILASGLRISAIVSRQRKELGVQMPDVAVYGSLPEMLESGTTDLVVIATPNSLHVEQATAALRAGCHVLIDKPAALHSSELEPLIDLAAVSGRQAAVFQNRRWDGDFLTIKRLLQNNTLGSINAFHMRWDRFRPDVAARWRERIDGGGGVLLDLGPHMVDQVLQLFGRPDWLQASIGAQRQRAVTDDSFEILMGKGPLLITLGVSSLAAAATCRYVVHGSRGSFVKSGLDVQERQLRDGVNPQAVSFGHEPQAQWGQWTMGSSDTTAAVETERGCWVQLYRLLTRSIESLGPVPVSLEEARDVMQVLEAARLSSTTGRRVTLS
jgi:predicted dehydrogenase